jgi:hypothetical protein
MCFALREVLDTQEPLELVVRFGIWFPWDERREQARNRLIRIRMPRRSGAHQPFERSVLCPDYLDGQSPMRRVSIVLKSGVQLRRG